MSYSRNTTMSKSKSFYLVVVFVLIFKCSFSQSVSFRCDTNFQFHRINWADSTQAIYDSLNRIDFSKEDIELRIWHLSTGLAGRSYNVFIMRHYIEKSQWTASYYKAFRGLLMSHKSMDEFFAADALIKSDSAYLGTVWDTLVSKGILTCQQPSEESLAKMYGSNDRGMWEDCGCSYVFELVKKGCGRKFSYDCCAFFMDTAYSKIPEFRQMNGLSEYLDKFLK